MKRVFASLFVLFMGACATGKAAGPQEIRTHTINDSGAVLMAQLTHETKGPRQVELVLNLRVSGLEETEKLVSSVLIKGFNVADGSLRWTGFVPPRQPQIHRVTLEVPEGMSEGTATVTLARSADSEVLLREEVTVTVAGDGKVSVSSE